MFHKKPKSGYQQKPQKLKGKKYHYLSSLIVAPTNKVSFTEKIVKFIIFVALRLVIKPSKWKNPDKNYEVIDRTYKRIMSSDFIYVPSSIAFYLIMSFMPILSMITLVYLIPSLDSFLTTTDANGNTTDAISEVVGRFIPGAKDLLVQIRHTLTGTGEHLENGAIVATLVSLFASTWIAAGGFAKIIFTQSYIFEHKFVGGYWMNKLKGMTMVLTFTIFLAISLAINVSYNNYIEGTNMSRIGKSVSIYAFLVIALFFAIFIGFALLFKISPRYKIRFKEIIPGTMVTTIPTAGFLALFGTISSYWSYGSYGSIGVIMYIGMASLIVTYFIFVGITTNAAYYKTFVSSIMRNKKTLSKK